MILEYQTQWYWNTNTMVLEYKRNGFGIQAQWCWYKNAMVLEYKRYASKSVSETITYWSSSRKLAEPMCGYGCIAYRVAGKAPSSVLIGAQSDTQEIEHDRYVPLHLSLHDLYGWMIASVATRTGHVRRQAV